MGYKFANQTAKVYMSDGRPAQIRRGEAWDESAAIVIDRPDMFDDDPPVIHGESTVVEQATAVPGEKRRTKRAAKRG